jgi:hypothetical protein
MFTYSLWWLEQVLRFVLVVFLLRGKALSRYPVFFVYALWVMVDGIARMFVYAYRPQGYLQLYWYTEFVSVALGYALVWEIYKLTLRQYPGTFRMARGIVSALFVGALLLAFVNAFGDEASALIRSVVAFERNVRAIQAVLLICVLTLSWYYAISFRRNLGGLILGYSLLTGMNVITLTLRNALGASFQMWWQLLQQSIDVIALIVWVAAFFVLAPELRAETPADAQYTILADRTSHALSRAWQSIFRTFQS